MQGGNGPACGFASAVVLGSDRGVPVGDVGGDCVGLVVGVGGHGWFDVTFPGFWGVARLFVGVTGDNPLQSPVC